MMDGEIDFLIVSGGLLLAIDQQESELPAVGARGKVVVGGSVGVVPASAGGVWGKAVTMRGSHGDHWRAFFHGTIVERIDSETMPMGEVGFRSGVRDIDGDGNTLTQPKEWSRNLAVEGDGLYGDAGTDVERARLDAKKMISLPSGGYGFWGPLRMKVGVKGSTREDCASR